MTANLYSVVERFPYTEILTAAQELDVNSLLQNCLELSAVELLGTFGRKITIKRLVAKNTADYRHLEWQTVDRIS